MVLKGRRERNNASKKFLPILVFLILMGFILFANIPIATHRIPATFIYGNHSGFDLSPEVLSFGMISSESSASRGVIVSNDFNYPILIVIESVGEITSNLFVSENNFYLEPFESREIIFTVYPDDLTEFKKYEGAVVIYSYPV